MVSRRRVCAGCGGRRWRRRLVCRRIFRRAWARCGAGSTRTKAVEDVAEGGVDVEAEDFGGEFHVLLEEDGDALAVGFDFLDEVGDLIDVADDGGVFTHVGFAEGVRCVGDFLRADESLQDMGGGGWRRKVMMSWREKDW